VRGLRERPIAGAGEDGEERWSGAPAPFVPNQCIIFIKTFNSLHSVKRMTETGSNLLRKTITIVIEHDE